MRSFGCPHSPGDNTHKPIHFITPPSIVIGVPYSLFYYLSPCSYSYRPLCADQGAEFSSCGGGGLLYFVVFISGTRMKRAWGRERESTLSASTHLAAWHWGIRQRQGRDRIFYLTLPLSVGSSGRPRLLGHTRWSAAALHVIMKATSQSEAKSACNSSVGSVSAVVPFDHIVKNEFSGRCKYWTVWNGLFASPVVMLVADFFMKLWKSAAVNRIQFFGTDSGVCGLFMSLNDLLFAVSEVC